MTTFPHKKNLDRWLEKFHKALSNCITPPADIKLPGPNTGHAFWKKKYNAIAAQGKHLKNIIDILAQKNPEIQKACKILN